ncbi:hypothetical protein [Sorangium sp. Soce836]|uniref:Uncharacterized protein n=1 Tax=Sorangium cellulosum TaxID=56 RepID=A0A4P2QMS3_SORCE|nr:hypothetical protein [Sorangium sp. Soce836]AUX31379.1 hypothetical protein SOCE836_035080 [Sorangium cellulosum]WCQ90762.1 hypothetical protein NQZ70_03473 [Sorangium sp. Soce836]
MSLVLAAPPAVGQVPPGGARLSYARGPGAEGCPEEQALRDVVAAQLGGTDPFVDGGGGRRVEVILARKGRHFVGEIAVYDGDGRRRGGQELTSAACGALVEDVGTALAIVLRPVRSAREPAPSQAAPEATAPPETASAPELPETASPRAAPAGPPHAPAAAPAPPCRPTAPVRPMERRGPALAGLRLQLGVGALISEGFAPAPAVGFSGFVGARWEAFSLSLEGRVDLPVATGPYQGRTFAVSSLGGSVVSCGHVAWFFGCGLVTAGRVRRFGMVDVVGEALRPYAGLGLRGGVEVPFSYDLAARLTGELAANLVRPTLHLGGGENLSVAGTSAAGGLHLVASF